MEYKFENYKSIKRKSLAIVIVSKLQNSKENEEKTQ